MKLSFWFILFLLLPNAPAAELGRLFNTPEQRHEREYRTTQTASPPQTAGTLIVNGVVQKQGGNRTLWINGIAQPAGRANDAAPALVTVTVPGSRQPLHLRVGEKVLPDGQKIPPGKEEAP